MSMLPAEIQEYLSTNDTLVRATLFQRHPELRETLASEQTRATLLEWLANEEPWEPENSRLIVNCLDHLRGKAQESEAGAVKPFLMHTDPFVRLKAYEFLLTLYFPDRNREAMFLLFNGMLSDREDQIRAQAARYIQRANAVADLKDFLARWLKQASRQGWETTESYELVEQLLQG